MQWEDTHYRSTHKQQERFFAKFDNDLRIWRIFEQHPSGQLRLLADHVPTAMWAEAMITWMNSLELVPELQTQPPRHHNP